MKNYETILAEHTANMVATEVSGLFESMTVYAKGPVLSERENALALMSVFRDEVDMLVNDFKAHSDITETILYDLVKNYSYGESWGTCFIDSDVYYSVRTKTYGTEKVRIMLTEEQANIMRTVDDTVFREDYIETWGTFEEFEEIPY